MFLVLAFIAFSPIRIIVSILVLSLRVMKKSIWIAVFSPLWSCFVLVICNYFWMLLLETSPQKPLQKPTRVKTSTKILYYKQRRTVGGRGRRGRKLVLQITGVLTFYQQNGRLQVVIKQTSKSIFAKVFVVLAVLFAFVLCSCYRICLFAFSRCRYFLYKD